MIHYVILTARPATSFRHLGHGHACLQVHSMSNSLRDFILTSGGRAMHTRARKLYYYWLR